MADAGSTGRARLVQGRAGDHSGSWDRSPGSPAPSPGLSLHLALPGMRQGPAWQRGFWWAGQPQVVSSCSHGSRRGPGGGCCTRPAACPGPDSQRGPRHLRAGRPGPAPSSACKQAQHRPELVTGGSGAPGAGACPRHTWACRVPAPGLGKHSAPEPGGPGVTARLRCTQVSYCTHRASVSPSVKWR